MTTSSRPARVVPALAAAAMALAALGAAGAQWLGAQPLRLQAELDAVICGAGAPGDAAPVRQPASCTDCAAFPLQERSL